MSVQAKARNASLSLAGKTAVISGGTQGIGEGVVMRLAQLGASRVFVVGRNNAKGSAVIQKLRDSIALRAPPDQKEPNFQFFRADLSTTSAVVELVQKLKEKVGQDGIDYLVMTQGGPPNGLYEETSEGIEKSFAVNCLSRFGLSYLLAESGTLNRESSVVSVLSPGFDFAGLDIEDLSLKKLNGGCAWRPAVLINQGKRDSVVTDAMTLQFNRRYPCTTFYHLFPGIVSTSALANRGFPFPIPQLGALFSPILAQTIGNTPTTYADVPIYFAANPEAKNLGGWMFNERLKRVNVGAWAREPTNQERLFLKLKSAFET